MKAAILFVLCLLVVVALAAGRPESGSTVGFLTRQLKQDHDKHDLGNFELVDCIPKEKDCPSGYYCVYFPQPKCFKQKTCNKEKVQKCAKYGFYFEAYASDHESGQYHPDKVQKKNCVRYEFVDKDVCKENEVCYEFACAELLPKYH